MSLNLLRLLRASRLSTCLVSTPQQENFAPSLINSKRISSPSGLIAVRFPKSIASFRPSRSRPASRQALWSSAVQGGMSLPSISKVLFEGASLIEILNMCLLQITAQPKCHRQTQTKRSAKLLSLLNYRDPTDCLVSKCVEGHFDTVEDDDRRSPSQRPPSGQETLRGSIPSFFIREIKVVRLRPMRAAAPSGPATRPLVSFKIRSIWSRSFASRVPTRGIALPLFSSSLIGTFNALPCVRITER